MNKQRLEALSDGIFAIVMTLLIIEIHVPVLKQFSEVALLDGILHLAPLFYSFFLSFGLITTTWVSHHFLFTIAAGEKVSRTLLYINMLFMAFVSLTPFSSHLLGSYPESQIAVAFYSLNVLILSGLIFVMRLYIVEKEDQTGKAWWNPLDRFYANVRMTLSALFPLSAILISFYNTYISVGLLVFSVVINVIPGIIGYVTRLTGMDKKARVAQENFNHKNSQKA